MQGRRRAHLPRRSGTRKFRRRVSARCAAQTRNARKASITRPRSEQNRDPFGCWGFRHASFPRSAGGLPSATGCASGNESGSGDGRNAPGTSMAASRLQQKSGMRGRNGDQGGVSADGDETAQIVPISRLQRSESPLGRFCSPGEWHCVERWSDSRWSSIPVVWLLAARRVHSPGGECRESRDDGSGSAACAGRVT